MVRCAWPGCTERVPPHRWGCLPHWRRLPWSLKSRILTTNIARHSPAYIEIVKESQRWALQHALTQPTKKP